MELSNARWHNFQGFLLELLKKENRIMEQDIQIRKAAESDLDSIEKLYEDICGYLETHKNYPGWQKGSYPSRRDAEKGLMADGLYIACIGSKTAGAMILKHEPEEGYKNGR